MGSRFTHVSVLRAISFIGFEETTYLNIGASMVAVAVTVEVCRYESKCNGRASCQHNTNVVCSRRNDLSAPSLPSGGENSYFRIPIRVKHRCLRCCYGRTVLLLVCSAAISPRRPRDKDASLVMKTAGKHDWTAA